LKNKKPTNETRTWVYSPTRAHLPGPVEKTGPWMIGYDSSQVQHFQQRYLGTGGDRWFEATMLRPVDRHIRQYMRDRVALGRACSLRDFLRTNDMDIRKGGSPAQTGLPASMICGADKFKDNDFRKYAGVELIHEGSQDQLIKEDHRPKLPASWARQVNGQFLRRFSGHLLIVPRSMQDLAFVSRPLAYNSSLNAIFFTKQPRTQGQRILHKHVLVALGRYLESGIARYLIAITGRLWMLDRTRLEKNDLLDLPVPFTGPQDPLIDQLDNAKAEDMTTLLIDRFGLSGSLAEAIQEYDHFRRSFEDGGVPPSFAQQPSTKELASYEEALVMALRPVSEGRAKVRIAKTGDTLVPYRVAINLSGSSSSLNDLGDSKGIADFSESVALRYNAVQTMLELRKPAERFRWTIESAYTDGAAIIQALMEETA
jgi:hypothetical protein